MLFVAFWRVGMWESWHVGELECTIVAADDHVLDGFSGPGHVHAVRQVGPSQARVVHLLL